MRRAIGRGPEGLVLNRSPFEGLSVNRSGRALEITVPAPTRLSKSPSEKAGHTHSKLEILIPQGQARLPAPVWMEFSTPPPPAPTSPPAAATEGVAAPADTTPELRVPAGAHLATEVPPA